MRGLMGTFKVGMASLVWLALSGLLVTVGAWALPAGRHYEMVSPTYKGGYGVLALNAVAMVGPAEGERVEFESFGSFAGATNNPLLGNAYLARRSTSGWSTEPLMLPSTSEMPYGNATASTRVSASLESVLFEGALTVHRGEASQSSEEGPHREEFVLQRLGGHEAEPTQVLYEPLAAVGLGEGPMPRLSTAGVSSDLCHVVIQPEFPPGSPSGAALLPEGAGLTNPAYVLTAGRSVNGCGGESPGVRLLALEVGSKGEQVPMSPHCYPVVGATSMGPNAISADGSAIFFEDDPPSGEGKCDDENGYFPSGPSKLFVRLNSERTIEVSRPVPADCFATAVAEPCQSALPQRAVFSGANKTGTRVFFTTVQPLVNGDSEFTCRETEGRLEGTVQGLGEFSSKQECENKEGKTKEAGKWKRFGNDIYMASLECPGGGEACPVAEREVASLHQVSHSVVPGETSEVQGQEAMVVSRDGERVYFVAQGVLTSGANGEGRVPVKGADNVYVYDVSEDKNRFVVDLCSGSSRSGMVVDRECPGSRESTDSVQWLGNRQAEATKDGEFLAFTSYGRLTPDDTDTARDVYRYDATTESLERVSVGENGSDSNGNNDIYNIELPGLTTFGVSPQEDFHMPDRVMSDDGSRIVFGTDEPLSSEAVNGLSNVYEWHDGVVSLVSSGTAVEPEGGVHEPAVITGSGRDVFFISSQGLVPKDIDGVFDVYDARLEEGFPEAAAGVQACEGDACQGPLSNPAPVLVPGSISQVAGENFRLPRKKARRPKKARRVRRKGKHSRRRTGRAHRGGR